MTHTDPYARLPDPARQAGFYADVPLKRLGAFVVDLIVIFALTTLISLATFGIVFFIFPAVAAVLGFIYRVLTLASGSATWGMRLMGIELRRHDAGRLSLVDAFVHT